VPGDDDSMDGRILEALFPGARRRILAAFFGEPDRWWSLGELAGRAGLRPESLRQHIAPWRDSGILRQRRSGGTSLFRPDPANPVFAELRAMVSKLSSPSGVQETILVVEDQPATAQITRILLESWGYRVLEAHGGDEALHLFEEHGAGIHLLLSDVLMPGMSGPQLVEELRRRNPQLRVVLMSGYASDQTLRHETSFLAKPFNPAGLARIVRKELDRRVSVAPHMNMVLD